MSDREKRCYLNTTPNRWGCHDPQCLDSTWDHECPIGPCTLPEHGHLTLLVDLDAEREQRRDPDYDGRTCPRCGAAWFQMNVVFNKEGRMTGHTIPACTECGGSYQIDLLGPRP